MRFAFSRVLGIADAEGVNDLGLLIRQQIIADLLFAGEGCQNNRGVIAQGHQGMAALGQRRLRRFEVDHLLLAVRAPHRRAHEGDNHAGLTDDVGQLDRPAGGLMSNAADAVNVRNAENNVAAVMLR